MDLSFTEEEERYRARVRDFLKENLPEGWGTPGYKMHSRRGDDGAAARLEAPDA